MSEVPLAFPLMEGGVPVYQRLALAIRRLRHLGLSRRRIAKALGIDDKTVAKAARWLEEPCRRPFACLPPSPCLDFIVKS